MGRKYPPVNPGQWVKPKRCNYRMMCCDCGLVHRINFVIEKRGNRTYLYLQAFRDNRATAATRRRKKKRKHQPE